MQTPNTQGLLRQAKPAWLPHTKRLRQTVNNRPDCPVQLLANVLNVLPMRCVVVAVVIAVVADTSPAAAAEFAQFVVGFSIVFVAVVVAAVVVADDDDDNVVVIVVVVIVGIFSRWFRCKSVNGFVVELCPVVVVPFAVSGVVVAIAVAPVAAAIVVAVAVAVVLAYLMHLLIKSRLRHISLFNFSRSILLLDK